MSLHQFPTAHIAKHSDVNLEEVELSKTETDILIMLASGKSLFDISSILLLSQNTVSIYQKRIREKLNANSCSQAVARAIKFKYISLADFT